MVRIALIPALLALTLALAAPPAGAATSYCCGPFGTPGEIVFSPDGRHAYVSDYQSTLALSRDPAEGTLATIEAFDGGGWTAAITSDGKFLYVGGRFPHPALTAFARDAESGRLTVLQQVRIPEHPTTIDVLVSPDDRQLYVTSRDQQRPGGISTLDIAADGRVTLRETLAPQPPPDAIWHWVPGGMTLSPDGRDLYVAAPNQEGVERFARAADGGLTRRETVTAGGFGPFESVASSPDGSRVYHGPTSLAVLARDASGALSFLERPARFQDGGYFGDPRPTEMLAVARDSGAVYAFQEGYLLQGTPTATGLALKRSYRDGVDGVSGLEHGHAIALSPDGRNLYVTTRPYFNADDRPGSVAVFSRDPATDALTFVEHFKGPVTAPPEQLPPPNFLINRGAEYTNDPNVELAIWPQHNLTGLRLSNDGGFKGAGPTPLSADGLYDWTLASSGPELQPKTVYAWFEEGGTVRIVKDSILLDERAPEIVEARLRRSRLRLSARDALSGVTSVQIAPSGRPRRAWRPYRTGAPYRVTARSARVRVRDKVGNASGWRKVRRR